MGALAIAAAGAAASAAAAGYSASQSGGGGAPGAKKAAADTVQLRDRFGGRNYAQDYEDALRYGSLNQLMWQQGLYGSPGGTINDVPYSVQGENGKFTTKTRDIINPQSEGLISLLNRTQGAVAGMERSSDPEGFGLLQSLTNDASGLLSRGDNPMDYQQDAQRAMQDAALRGRGHGTGDAVREAVRLAMGRQDRQIARGGYAAGVLGARRSYLGDPMQASLQLMGGSIAGMGGPVQRTNLFDPTQIAQQGQNAYAMNLSNQNSALNNLSAAGAGLANMGLSMYQTQNAPRYNPNSTQLPYRGAP